MFNKTFRINLPEPKICPITQVVEKTITPDKVTEMYDSVREQVEKDVLRTIVIKDNSLNAVILELRHEFSTDQRRLLFRFTLNGKEYIQTDYTTSREELTPYQLTEKCHELLKGIVADKIIKENITIFIKK